MSNYLFLNWKYVFSKSDRLLYGNEQSLNSPGLPRNFQLIVMYKVNLVYLIHSQIPLLEELERRESKPRIKKVRGHWSQFQLTGKPWAHAELVTELTFPPFYGLCIGSKHGTPTHSVVRLSWRTNDHKADPVQHFQCALEDRYPKGSLTYEMLKQIAVDNGFKVHEFGGKSK